MLFHSKVIVCMFAALPAYAEQVIVNSEQDLEQDPIVELNIQDDAQTKKQLSSQLRANLNAQFEKIQTLIKTEDAYSAKLGEEYLNYGLLLKQAGEIDEAREMIVDALHILKVNEGVYSIEQRPYLRALFDINFLLGKSEEMEGVFNKIRWVEDKNPDHRDSYSMDIMVKLGHHFLDRYSIQPFRSEVSLAFIENAVKYFSGVLRQYGSNDIDVSLMPYGELLDAHIYRHRLAQELNSRLTVLGGGRGFGVNSRRSERFGQSERPKGIQSRLPEFRYYANQYLTTARIQKNQVEIVKALLAIADSNLILKRKKGAAEYYQLAWDEAQKLAIDDPIRLSFNQPVKLPAFDHLLKNEEAKRQGAIYAHLSVIVSVNADGEVTAVDDNVIGASNKKLEAKVKRAIKKTKFRPVIVDGGVSGSDQHKETVRVLVSKNNKG